MERIEDEKMLMDPAALERLRAWSLTARQTSGWTVDDEPAATALCIEVGRPAHLQPPRETSKELEDGTAGSAITRVHELASVLPELENKAPLDVLNFMEKRFRSDASSRNAALLQAAINSVTDASALTTSETSAVDRAMELFHAGGDKSRDAASDDIWCKYYVDSNFTGASIFDDMTPGWGYWRRPNYAWFGMNDKISSLSYNAHTDEAGGSIILFEHAGYRGRYRNFPVIPGHRQDVWFIGNDFNDTTSSSLIIRRWPNETRPLSLSALVPQAQIADIVNAQDDVGTAGDARFSWDMWPTGNVSSTDVHPNQSERSYIYVNVPITVHTPWPFANYYAEVRYWINLYVDRNGNIQGYVEHYGCHVESGIIHNRVARGLTNAIPGTVGAVNELISNAVVLPNLAGPYRFTYYLPGRFELSGNTGDDVSIVAVR